MPLIATPINIKCSKPKAPKSDQHNISAFLNPKSHENVPANVFMPVYASLWQAKLTFIHNYRYPQFKLWISTIRIVDINNCSELLISIIWIADINNSNCWYQQFELWISTILIVDIYNNYRYQQLNTDINNSNCWYQQFKLSISTIVNKC